METIGSVYILESEDKTLLKIGYSTRLFMRLKQLAKHVFAEFHAGVRIIGFFPGTRAVESELHRRFAEYRVHGDWYKREPVLRALPNVLVPIFRPFPMASDLAPMCHDVELFQNVVRPTVRLPVVIVGKICRRVGGREMQLQSYQMPAHRPSSS